MRERSYSGDNSWFSNRIGSKKYANAKPFNPILAAILLSFVVLIWFDLAETGAINAAPTNATPRSDARVLHVDFENYVDGVVQPLNAGVRWLGDPFSGRKEGLVEVTRKFSFSGKRAGHVDSQNDDQIARIRLQSRFDAPQISGDSVIEFMFRAVEHGNVDCKSLCIWDARSPNGRRVGIALFANSQGDSNSYQLDVSHASQVGSKRENRVERVTKGLDGQSWIRVIQYRKQKLGKVDLWIGPPGKEVFVDSYNDFAPKEILKTVEVGDTSTKQRHGSGFWDDIRVGGVLGPNQTVAQAEPPLRNVNQERPDFSQPIVLGETRQLFIDDAIIESAENVTRQLHPVQKRNENPLLVPDKPWEGKSVLLYGAVVHDPKADKFKMWYLAWGKHVGQGSYVCYAESNDGIHWHKPELGLVEFEGSKQNNIVMPGWSQTSVHLDSSDPDPMRRYKALLRYNGIRAFTSPDGLHWADRGPVIDQGYDATTPHWDPIGKKWIAMVKIFRDGKRARGYAESKDFLNWSDTYDMLTTDERDDPGDQMYANCLFHYESAYFGLLRMYHTNIDKVDIQLMTSRNAKHWNRDIRTAFIPTGDKKGDWDFANNSVPSTPPLRMGDELWFYYSGRSTLHNEIPNDGSIGLGTLRVDGFISLDANESAGTVTTRTMTLTKTIKPDSGDLHINANASQGKVLVEVLDRGGNVIPGYAMADCLPIQSNSVGLVVRWRNTKSISALAGQQVQLRFSLQSAELYSFWVE